MQENEIVFGEKTLGPRVKDVQPQRNYLLRILFDNGETRLFDVKPLFQYPIFQKLKNEAFFNLAHAEGGTLVWTDDIDYCPDRLYEESTPLP